jgi:hypothetical protein
MKALSIVCAALALLFCAAIPLKSFAAAKDPDMLMAAAKLLASIDAPVADPKASAAGKPVFYDVDAIVAEADGYAANRGQKPTSRNYVGGFCHYEYLCDSLSCSYVWVC